MYIEFYFIKTCSTCAVYNICLEILHLVCIKICTINIILELKKNTSGPGQVAQLIGVFSHTPKAVGLTLGQGTYLGCGFDPQSGCKQ